MAYTITRKNRLKEELQLCHADGTLALTATVDINVDEIGQRVSKAYETLGMAQNELEKAPTSAEAMTAYGDAVIAVFNVIFGEEDTQNILLFYEGNYSEMLLDIFPFINDEIMPKIREASAARKNQLLDLANKSKGKRGIFGK
jgi:hypothetical protein